MENSNIKFTTKGGHEVEVRSFITGRQSRHIKDAFLEDTQFASTDGKQSYSVAASKTNIAEDRAIEAAVVSIDSKTEKVVDLVLDLPDADYAEVIAKVNEVTGGAKKE